jgi:hypothetical protein
MDPTVVLVITWLLAGLMVAAYIWFVVWRFRVDRRKKEAQRIADEAMSDAIAKTAQQVSTVPASSAAPAAAAPSTAPAAERSLLPTEATVADLVSGIALPHELVPLTTIAPRPAVGDRVAFWTDRAPAEIVAPAFAAELERLGYSVTSLDEWSLAAHRDDDRLLVAIHPNGAQAIIGDQLAFSSVPEFSVVIEVWVPA